VSLILDALRKSEHERHGASDSVLPLIVTPRAGRVRKKRVAYLPILIMLLVVSATVVIFLYRETIFPPRTVTQAPPIPVVEKPQVAQQRRAEAPVKEVRQLSPSEVEPTQSIVPVKREKLPLSKPEIAMPDPAVADRPKIVKRSLPQKPEPESAIPPEVKARPAPKLISKPKPKPKPGSFKRDAIPAALSTFPADFIRKVQPLHLDFHVYSSDISRRMVYINNREYEEGDHLKNSLKVVRIVPQGAVMQWNQQSFLLTAQD
jgi:general secretion pathway protein B